MDIVERLRLRLDRIPDGWVHTCSDTCTHLDCLAVGALREIERLHELLFDIRTDYERDLMAVGHAPDGPDRSKMMEYLRRRIERIDAALRAEANPCS